MASAIRLCPRARRGSAFKSPPNIPRRISISLWSSLLQLKTNSVFRLPRHWEPKFPRPSASRFGPYCFYLRDSFPSLSAYIAENLRLFKKPSYPGKKRAPHLLIEDAGQIPGNDLLSQDLSSHYHRRCSVSLPGSEWDRVVPLRSGHQNSTLSFVSVFSTGPSQTCRSGELSFSNKC